MNLDTQFKLKSNPLLQRYIREHSYWYKLLNRNPDLLSDMNEEMKKEYKLTTADRINNLSEKITLVQSFLNMLK